SIELDYALTNDRGKTQDAITQFKTIKRSELPIPFGKFSTSRYSLIEVCPKTGRVHQIRKHLNHLRHPIIGDRPHGCNKQNRLFKERWNMTTMLLHAQQLELLHPVTKEQLVLKARPFEEFNRMLHDLGLNV
ncbi:MAG: pseudouridine synthase, partial [Bacteroidales bacterium]|nr:pseudouridine synthase [Bacteroidales bacterium]